MFLLYLDFLLDDVSGETMSSRGMEGDEKALKSKLVSLSLIGVPGEILKSLTSLDLSLDHNRRGFIF